MCPFSFGILYSFGCCWCYNEAFSCDCYASKSQLNVCSSQKSACHFPRGLLQESVWEPVICQGLHVCGLCSRNQKKQQQQQCYLPSPHCFYLSDRVTPFCLSSSAHKYSELYKKEGAVAPAALYAASSGSSAFEFFFTSICKNQPHSSLFWTLHWTFAFCLAPLAVKKKKKFLLCSPSLPPSSRCFIQPQTSPPPRPVSVWMCWDFSIFFLFFFFSVRTLFALCRMQRESSQRQQPRHMKNKSVLLSGQYCSSAIALFVWDFFIVFFCFFFSSWTSYSRYIWFKYCIRKKKKKLCEGLWLRLYW